MLIEKIKPIPKYILEKIQKADKKANPNPNGVTRYYSYITKNDGELVKITVAVRHCRTKWYCKQVAVHGVNSTDCFVKDMVYFYIGGYHTGWYSEGLTKYPKHYEYNDWGYAGDKYFDPYAPCVNREYAERFPQYKYCALSLSYMEVIKYIRLYEKYPQIEYLTKAKLHCIADSKQILEKVGKDKNFRKFLNKNAEFIRTKTVYIQSILKAYKTGKPLEEVQDYEVAKKALISGDFAEIRGLFKDDLDRYFSYISKNKTTNATYKDYLKACTYLNIDMSQDKNRYPHDFKKWHDIRIDEYRTKKALEDAEKRKELYEKFSIVADKYTPLQKMSKGVFICIIAKSPAELVREGEILHHCVGRMNYEQKFIREETLIFFIRNANEPDTPLVTVEYSLLTKKILQCHSDHNGTPKGEIEEFIYKKWLPYANRQLKKIAA